MKYCEKGENIDVREPISRRRFLQSTGTIIFLVGTGFYVPARTGYGKLVKLDDHPDAVPPSQGYLLVDSGKCQGCTSCMLACSLVHTGVHNPSLSGIQIIQNSFESFPDDIAIEQCRQCVEPACVHACPEQALRTSAADGNVRMIDRSKCIGCGACVEACPYRPGRTVVARDAESNGEMKGFKCDLCAAAPYHWDAAGGGPDGKQACAEVCPVGAIQFTKEIPVQRGDTGYEVNLRTQNWWKLGYPKN